MEKNVAQMIILDNPKRADKLFPYGNREWGKTTMWLYEVGVGGGYEQHSQNTWVEVEVPDNLED